MSVTHHAVRPDMAEEEEEEAPSMAEKEESRQEQHITDAFYYMTAVGGAPLGPCTIPQLGVLWQSGQISAASLLWREGMGEWKPVGQIEEASSLLSLKQPPAVPGSVWYYLDSSGRQRGSLTSEQMGALLRRGEVDGLTHVWRSGMAAWTELGQVSELREELLVDAGADDDADDDAEEKAREALILAEQTAYDPLSEPVPPPSARVAVALAAAAPAPASDKPKRVRKKKKFVSKGGSNVYVSGIPDGVEPLELAECFKVAGLFKTEVDGTIRMKVYTTEDGRPKGDALLSFMKPESVQLAVTLRDGHEIRPGRPLSVQPARFEVRGELTQRDASKDAALQRKKQKMLERRRLAEWDDALLPSGVRASTVVILKGLFTAEEATEADADFYANLKQDVQVECAKAGEVDKVTVFEGSEHGAAAVRFKRQEDAQRCVSMMCERTFGSGKLACELYDGVTDYRAKARQQGGAPADGGDGVETIEEQEEKLESFAQWIEADSTDEDPDADDE